MPIKLESNQSVALDATLVDSHDSVILAAEFRAGQWALILKGTELARTESSGMVLATLDFFADAARKAGDPVRIRCSLALKAAAVLEAEINGMTLDRHLQILRENLENLPKPKTTKSLSDRVHAKAPGQHRRKR